jgi:drug/metabolite transporter superfamily protein YnfA
MEFIKGDTKADFMNPRERQGRRTDFGPFSSLARCTMLLWSRFPPMSLAPFSQQSLQANVDSSDYVYGVHMNMYLICELSFSWFVPERKGAHYALLGVLTCIVAVFARV